jgi:cysteine desulfurase / selenocysteine lyase
MDVARIRAEFPILHRMSNGHPFVYLDSAATSQKPEVVIRAEADYYRTRNANPHRGVYELSEAATDAYESARAACGKFVGATSTSEVVFLRGATEALNLLAYSLGRRLSRGDRVVTTVMEHHSNIVPWQMLREQKGIELDFVDVDTAGRLREGEIDRLLALRPKIVTLAHASNVLGTVNPVREIAEKAHAVGATVIVDAAQSAPHLPVDAGRLGADFLTFSGHKTLGPMGIGVLWGRQELLDHLDPWMGGGEMIREVHQDRVLYRESPARFEAGTPNVGGAVGLHTALDYLQAIGWDELGAHERDLFRYAWDQVRLRFGEDLQIAGPPPGAERTAVIAFSVRGMHPHDIASLLDAQGVAVRSGQHCAQPLMDRLGVSALTRASPYLYNDRADLDRCFDALETARRVFA